MVDLEAGHSFTPPSLSRFGVSEISFCTHSSSIVLLRPTIAAAMWDLPPYFTVNSTFDGYAFDRYTRCVAF